ncbi:MAG: hypothetical protein WKF75_16855 [Singulisphaera sp.]
MTMVMTISPRRLARLALLGTALLPGAMVRARQSDGLGIVTGSPTTAVQECPHRSCGARLRSAGRAASDSTPKPTTTTEAEKPEESSMRLIGSRDQCIRCHAVNTPKGMFDQHEGGAINQFSSISGHPDPQGLGATLEQADQAVRAQLACPTTGAWSWSLAPDGRPPARGSR